MKFVRRTFLVLLIFCSAQAFAFEVERREEKLILKAPRCEMLSEISRSLQSWSHCEHAPDLVTTPVGCEADITSCVSSVTKRFQSITPRADGPNCWNLALVHAGILPGLRYTTGQEMSFYLKSPLCRLLRKEERRAGDIASIHNELEIHAFIYISDEISFSKNGASSSDPFALQPTDNLLSIYQAPPNELSFYRCDSLANYWQAHPKPPKEGLKFIEEVSDFEVALQDRSVFGTEIPIEMREKILTAMKTISTFLDANPKPRAKEIEFVLDLLVFRFEAIVKQLNFSANEFLSVEVNSRLLEIRRKRN